MKVIAVFLWIMAAGATGYSLFWITFEVEKLEAELVRLNREILREQETLHVLKAEWSYLNRPGRLENLANELLPDLRFAKREQFVTFDDIPQQREDGPAAAASAAVEDGEKNENVIKVGDMQ